MRSSTKACSSEGAIVPSTNAPSLAAGRLAKQKARSQRAPVQQQYISCQPVTQERGHMHSSTENIKTTGIWAVCGYQILRIPKIVPPRDHQNSSRPSWLLALGGTPLRLPTALFISTIIIVLYCCDSCGPQRVRCRQATHFGVCMRHLPSFLPSYFFLRFDPP